MAEVKPNVSYQWKNDELFNLTGKQFESLINGIRTILSTPESQKILMLAELGKIMEEVLAKGIEEGKAVEAKAPQPMVAVPAEAE